MRTKNYRKALYHSIGLRIDDACNIYALVTLPLTSGVIKMNALPNCPQCGSEYPYEDGAMLVCPECSFEWEKDALPPQTESERIVKDANGNILQDGDTITVIKELKIKGSSLVVKVGTKVKNIRLVEGDHDIDCKIDGIGAMKLKSQFVKKA